jgi:hypothetical protein
MTMTPLETAQSRTLKEIAPIVRQLIWMRGGPTQLYQWRRDRIVNEYCRNDKSREEECNAFIEWALSDSDALEEYIAKRSPSTAAELALRNGRRLCPVAEKFITEKAKSKPKLLEYCSNFGILLDDMSQITMKAAFEDDSRREKEYIKKMEHTKKRIKEFLEQMVSIGQLDSGITVKQLIETL